MDKVSIIVPIYNAEKYLNKCLDSLINQTMAELEFILINDGSTDRSEEIIKEYKDKRIKYFKNKNQGIGKTRNFGIEKSTGNYIMFIDSDDSIDKNTCEKLYQKMKSTDSDLVVCNFYREYDNGNLEEEIIPPFEDTTLKDNPEILTKINLSPWNKIYKRSLLIDNNIKFNEELKYEDVPFVVKALKHSKKISQVNESLNYYCIHGNSETTIRDRKCFDILKIIDIIRKELSEKEYQEDLNKLTVRMVTNYTIQQRVQENKKVGMEFIDKAFDYLKKEIPDYKNNKYYEDRGFLRRTIEKNKLLTKIYCRLYKN